MTGMAGILSLTGSLDLTQAAVEVEKMARAQSHRARRGWQVLTNSRLVCIAPAGSTPKPDPGPVLAFDGVIINREGMRDRLQRAGIEVPGATDGDWVAYAWKQWGADTVAYLDGRFAFAVHDPARGCSYLVRDPFGHRPLHYTIRGDRLYFASEIKSLLAVVGAPGLDGLTLLEWSLYGDVLAPRTLFRGVRSLAPGSLLEISADGSVGEPRTYYDPSDVVDRVRYAEHAARSIEESIELVRDTIEQAVRIHMNGRSDLGVMLSGGVDSAVIAALAARHARLPAYNFSIANNALLDERPMAGVVARHLGLSLEGVTVDGDTYRRELAPTTYHYEMPLWHMQAVPIRLLARRASQDDVGILLSGVSVGPLLGAAADRLGWILPPPGLERVPGAVFRVLRKAVYAASGLPVANPFLTINLGVGVQLVDGGARLAMVRRHEQAYAFLTEQKERRPHVMRMTDNVLFLRRFFHQGDRLCMAASVEYCDAAVTRDFEALAFNLPVRLMHRKGKWKWILKELATRYVPREVAFQKKIPLDVPVEEYFAPQFKASLFRDGFLASFLGMPWEAASQVVATARDRTPALLRLVNLETWGRLFFLGQSVDEVTELLTR